MRVPFSLPLHSFVSRCLRQFDTSETPVDCMKFSGPRTLLLVMACLSFPVVGCENEAVRENDFVRAAAKLQTVAPEEYTAWEQAKEAQLAANIRMWEAEEELEAVAPEAWAEWQNAIHDTFVAYEHEAHTEAALISAIAALEAAAPIECTAWKEAAANRTAAQHLVWETSFILEAAAPRDYADWQNAEGRLPSSLESDFAGWLENPE